MLKGTQKLLDVFYQSDLHDDEWIIDMNMFVYNPEIENMSLTVFSKRLCLKVIRTKCLLK